MSLIELKKVSKFYYNKNNITSGFSKLSLDLNLGEFVAITGESGSGKSTLLNVISGLDSYNDGEMFINGQETSHYTEIDYEIYRKKYVSNIFQNFNLINSYTVYQNVELVLLLNGYRKSKIKKKVLKVIDQVGLTKYKNTKASKLSGGQKQRVAIARALIKETPIIVADEPTGNLDTKSASEIINLLSSLRKDRLIIIVTHNYEQVSNYVTRKITMSDGKIVQDKKLKQTESNNINYFNFKEMNIPSKIRLAIRNTFNIKIKFLLLLVSYIILIFMLFFSYSSVVKINNEAKNYSGTNQVISKSSKDRIIINKVDKTYFTDGDYLDIEKISNIKKIEKDDLILGKKIDLSDEPNYNFYFYNTVFDYNTYVKKVDYGTLPSKENEIVIKGSKKRPYLSKQKDSLLKGTYQLFYGDDVIKDIKITGIIYDNNSIDYKFYLSNYLIDRIKFYYSKKNSKFEITLNNRIYKEGDIGTLIINNNIPVGNVIIDEEKNIYCEKENCINSKINYNSKNLYYTINKTFNVINVYNEENFEKLTGLKSNYYKAYTNSVFINEKDYNSLFDIKPYQSSIYVKDMEKIRDTVIELNNKGYNTYPIIDTLYVDNYTVQDLKLIKIFKIILFIIYDVVFFFISYMVIKMILKSRNKYYSILRILGATKKTIKKLLIYETINNINVAYFIFISFLILCNKNIIKISYVRKIIKLFVLRDYVVVYFVLLLMSLLISIKYSKKLFKDTALETYRQEI